MLERLVEFSDPSRATERRKIYKALFLLWLSLIVMALSWPWANFDASFHWNRVVWFPFQEKETNFLDIGLNILLFIPLGSFGMASRAQSSWRGVLSLTLAGLGLSLCGEIIQGFGVHRFPSTTDIANNLLGAFLGSLSVWLFRHLQS
jgi:glycopeptide antibiotics resistance protein